MKIVGYKQMAPIRLQQRVQTPTLGPRCPYATSGTDSLAPSLWKQVQPMMTMDFRTIAEATNKVVTGPRYSAAGIGAVSDTPLQDAKNVLVAAGVLLLLRGVAGWYVGSKMGRPTSGAVLGGVFGPVGLGVLSFWRK